MVSVIYLTPANEVWGEVMFLHVSVILSTRRFGFPVCITGHMTRYDQQAGGTHPTGMLFCNCFIQLVQRNIFQPEKQLPECSAKVQNKQNNLILKKLNYSVYSELQSFSR